jgi:hypothetical protein
MLLSRFEGHPDPPRRCFNCMEEVKDLIELHPCKREGWEDEGGSNSKHPRRGEQSPVAWKGSGFPEKGGEPLITVTRGRLRGF